MNERTLVVPADVVHEQQEVAPSGRVSVLGEEPSGTHPGVADGGRDRCSVWLTTQFLGTHRLSRV